jgi:ubiquinone/menaquinone biosynthesis C-methylase UbiE
VTEPARKPSADRPSREHYSYAHYANQQVAEGFDALRFSGDVGRFLLEEQAALLTSALQPGPGRHIADVGTGTGRAAIGLARQGARVVGLDASAEMLGVARTRANEAGLTIPFAVADGHALPLPDGSVDAAVCLRVLMHAIDWRRCLSELCRVSRSRVVVDFPAAASFAAIESLVRRGRRSLGHRVEAYRVIAERDVERAFEANGFRVVDIRRQFVLPIAIHKKMGSFDTTRNLERLLASAGLLRLFGSPVTMVAER